jgi:hypothetical protein
MQKVLPNLINSDQTGFLKERYIGENIRTIADIIDYTSLKNKPGVILLIDFEKAFDTIKWSFIIKSLKLFYFGPDFIQWIKTIYCNIESTVINNGHSVGFFELQRGIRQGCPVSPYLFILAVEILANAIRYDKSIKGLKVGSTELKVSQLADDTTILVSDFKSVGLVLDLLKLFQTVSGLKLNIDKTIAKCIGSLQHVCTMNMYGLTWSSEYVFTLGLTISNDPKVLIEQNFMPRLRSVDNILNIWHCRGLSLKGKVTILKSLVLPKLLYPMSVLPIPTYVVDLVDNMILDFVWGKRKHKIKKNVIIQDIDRGGIKVPHFGSMVEANRVSWVKRLLESSGKWKSVIEEIVLPMSLNDLIECNLDKPYIANIPVLFYRQVFDCWNSIKSEPIHYSDFKNQIIWNNRFIKLPEGPTKSSKVTKTLFWKKFYKAGIIRVGDLFIQNKFVNMVQLYRVYTIKTNFLHLHMLQKALPAEWLKSISSAPSVIRVSDNANLSISLIGSSNHYINIKHVPVKHIYNHIVAQKYVRPTALDRWNEYFDIDENDWPNIFKVCYYSSRETKLQTLHYKIIHRIFPCKKWLYNQKVINSPLCLLCSDTDDIIHYFIGCKHSAKFWIQLENWWNRISNVKIICTPKHVIFGMYYDNAYFSAVNHVLLLAKCYLYKCKRNQNAFCLYNFLGEFKK